MMPGSGRAVLVLVLAAHASACAAKMSPMQKRQITTRVVDATYDDTYRATMTVLQDHGYTIRNTDMDTGLISAYAFRQDDGTRGYELSCILEARTPDRTEIRMTIRRERTSEDRHWLAQLLSSDSPDVYDGDVYNGLFMEIAVETRRIVASR
jgi:hypothetical protein